MLVIVSQSYRFKAETEGETREIHVSPSRTPQQVPDWIREDQMFALATSDGSIVEVRSVLPEAEIKTLKPTEVRLPKTFKGQLVKDE